MTTSLPQPRSAAASGWYWAAIALGLLTGCGDNLPQTVPVEGRVTYRGKGVARGTVCFMPLEGSSLQPATGTLEADGTYRMRTYRVKDGILPGKYAVGIRACNSTDFLLDPRLKPDYAVPEKYLRPETSGLMVEVPADAVGPLRFDFDLQD